MSLRRRSEDAIERGRADGKFGAAMLRGLLARAEKKKRRIKEKGERGGLTNAPQTRNRRHTPLHLLQRKRIASHARGRGVIKRSSGKGGLRPEPHWGPWNATFLQWFFLKKTVLA